MPTTPTPTPTACPCGMLVVPGLACCALRTTKATTAKLVRLPRTGPATQASTPMRVGRVRQALPMGGNYRAARTSGTYY